MKPNAIALPFWGDLGSFEGARDILFAVISDEPIQEWNDPMQFAPEPSLAAILQVAGEIGEVFPWTEALRAEIALPADTHISNMLLQNWHQDPAAPMVGAGLQATSTTLPSPQSGNQPSMTFNSFWDHNGSRMGLIAQGTQRNFHYVDPRSALVERGVVLGTLLFEGERIGNRYDGLARIFASPPCGTFTYRVSGPVSPDQRSVAMYGRAPVVNSRCEIVEYRDDILNFTQGNRVWVCNVASRVKIIET